MAETAPVDPTPPAGSGELAADPTVAPPNGRVTALVRLAGAAALLAWAGLALSPTVARLGSWALGSLVTMSLLTAATLLDSPPADGAIQPGGSEAPAPAGARLRLAIAAVGVAAAAAGAFAVATRVAS